MFKKILSKLPKSLIHRMTRSQFKVPDLALDPNFTIKIAQTREELESAYSLLHDCYVAQRLMAPEESNLRCTLFSFLPETITIVAKYKDETVGTVSLINDSAMGLPSDEKYLKENNTLRAQGKFLVEVSSLAVDKKFRSTGHAVSLLLMKFLYNHVPKMGGTDLVITVHPRAQDFYESLLQFKRVGDIIQYGYVNGALAVYMCSPIINSHHLIHWSSTFKTDDFRKNMVLWLFNHEDSRFIYPQMSLGQVASPVLTADLMEYFFVKKTNCLENLVSEKREIFFQILVHYFGQEMVGRFSKFYANGPIKEFRTRVSLSGSLEVNNQFFIVTISDVSASGAFINCSQDPHFMIQKGDEIQLRFKVGLKSFHVKSQVRWIKTYDALKPSGFGVQFEEKLIELKDELRNMEHVREKIAA